MREVQFLEPGEDPMPTTENTEVKEQDDKAPDPEKDSDREDED
jgi:hypothetical protein